MSSDDFRKDKRLMRITLCFMLGILSCALCLSAFKFGGVFSMVVSFILGVVGWILCHKAKRAGDMSGIVIVGYVLNISGVVLSALILIVFAAYLFWAVRIFDVTIGYASDMLCS